MTKLQEAKREVKRLTHEIKVSKAPLWVPNFADFFWSEMMPSAKAIELWFAMSLVKQLRNAKPVRRRINRACPYAYR